MDRQAQRFVATWVITCIAIAAFAALFTFLMDPYLIFNIPRIEGFNARKPAAGKQERLVKAYDVTRTAPTTILLGSSRVDVGFKTLRSSRLDDASIIYNLGLAAGTPYMAHRYLQHVFSRHGPSTVVMGLDFEYFLTRNREDPRGTEAFERYLSIARDGRANPDRRWQSLGSLEGLVDSFTTLISNLRGESEDFTSAGNWDSKNARDRILATGSYPRVTWIDVFFARSYLKKTDARLDPAVFEDLRNILDLCASKHVQIILFISPVHADMLEIIDLSSFWDEFEDWKREVVTLAAHYNHTNGEQGVAIWDFSGYHRFAIEAVLQTRTLRWFWESSHYTPELGELLLRQMLGANDDDFGTVLRPETLESHLLLIREQRQRYRNEHASEVTRVHDLYNAVDRQLRPGKADAARP